MHPSMRATLPINFYLERTVLLGKLESCPKYGTNLEALALDLYCRTLSFDNLTLIQHRNSARRGALGERD